MHDNQISALAIPSPQTDQADPACGKRFATLRAQLALHGVSLYQLTDGSFIASKWNLTKPLTDFHAVASFAGQIGGAA